MPLYIEQSGDLDRCHRCLTDSLTHWQTLKDRATQLLIKYKSGALVTQKYSHSTMWGNFRNAHTELSYQKPYCPRFAEYNTTVHYDGGLIVQSPSQQPRSKETWKQAKVYLSSLKTKKVVKITTDSALVTNYVADWKYPFVWIVPEINLFLVHIFFFWFTLEFRIPYF